MEIVAVKGVLAAPVTAHHAAPGLVTAAPRRSLAVKIGIGGLPVGVAEIDADLGGLEIGLAADLAGVLAQELVALP